MAAKLKRVFYAYPSAPLGLGDTINRAIDRLKSEKSSESTRVRFYPWPEVRVGGTRLIANILKEIDRADVFACDLTYPNHNVSFELGYAIARFKRGWISLDSSIEGAEQRFRRLYFGLLGSGYAKYQNSSELASAFRFDRPDSTLDQTLLGAIYRTNRPLNESPTAVYIMPEIVTDAVIEYMQCLDDSVFKESLVVDDPKENRSPSLDWYSQNVGSADCVLVHMLANDQIGHEDHNVKASLVAGLAQGFQKSTLMVSMTPLQSPIDYDDLLRLHDTASACGDTVSSWLASTTAELPRRRSRRTEGELSRGRGRDVRTLAIGDPVAENERNRIDSYSVETASYFRASDDQLTIVVGRRGSVKSAQLYAMQAALRRDHRNHVCVIKPVGYEIDGLVRVLQSMYENSERGYLIESLWKYLIYSELARSLNEAISTGSANWDYGDTERRFLGYYDSRSHLLSPPFSERLDIAITSLSGVGDIQSAVEQRHRISELLHEGELRELRQELGLALYKYRKVHILIDNLDSPWGVSEHTNELAQLLWGLLLLSNDLVPEFMKSDSWRRPVNVYLTVFLRSDIFAAIQPKAPEQDKLPLQRIVWDDREVMKRLIDSRFEFGSSTKDSAEQSWRHLFPTEIVGKTPWDFVFDSVLPRPRDVVYLVRQAVDGAINRGHAVVTEEDLLDARVRYSAYAFKSVIAEDDPRKGRLESVLWGFARSPKVIGRSEIEKRLEGAGVAEEDFGFYIALLCDINFLAIGDSWGNFHFAMDEADRDMKTTMSRRIADQSATEELYEVASAFWQVLQIE